jgi:hypothetical protein
MRKIKNWKVFNESVEVSLEDIKWILVDYLDKLAIEDYEYYPNSSNLISFLVNDKFTINKDFGRIERLAKEEGWNVTYNGALIFYKGSKQESIMNWLYENFSDLKPSKLESGRIGYHDSSNQLIFNYMPDSDDIEVYDILHYLPLRVLYSDGDKLDGILKWWLNKTYNINAWNIYLD